MEVANWTSAGKIKADKIDANTIVAEMANMDLVHMDNVWINTLDIGDGSNENYIKVNGVPMKSVEITIDGKRFSYLGTEPIDP